MSNIDQILKSLANCAGQAESVFTYPNGIGIFWAWRSYVESGDCAGAKRMEVELAEEIDRDAKTASENIISAQEGLLARMLNLRAQLQKARKGTILDKFRYRKPDAASLLKLKIVNEGVCALAETIADQVPEGEDKKEAVKHLQIVRAMANSAIATSGRGDTSEWCQGTADPPAQEAQK